MERLTKGYNLLIHTNHFNLSYDDVGEGNIPIIFLHGFPFDKTMWQKQMEDLKTSYRVIACDIRGFGKSKDEVSHLSINLFAEDLIKFMDTLNISKAVICGLSMGGFIALNVIEKFPERFEALILCDTQCIADTTEVKIQRYKTIDQIIEHGPNNFNDAFTNSVFYSDTLDENKLIVDSLREIVFANSKHIIVAGLNALAERAETCSTLNKIKIPTLIICGKEDSVTPLVQSEMMHKEIKESLLHVIKNAGHVSNLEHPIEFNETLRNFLLTLKENNKSN